MLALPNDLFLSIVVIAAVVIFGALISVGNERQRKAIDKLHIAYKQWAVQDLRLKRGTVASQIQINDLQGWLTKAHNLGTWSQDNHSGYTEARRTCTYCGNAR